MPLGDAYMRRWSFVGMKLDVEAPSRQTIESKIAIIQQWQTNHAI